MNRKTFLELLSERVLFLDGAYGTEFFKQGYKGAVELLNIDTPKVVEDLQKAYAEAGADVVLTNTFSANRLKLRSMGLEEYIRKINENAVKIARHAAPGKLVLGDMSSTGMFVRPLGDLDFEEAYNVFREQAALLIDAGVDGIIVETMSDLKELKAAILAIRNVSTDIPLIAHMTFQADGISVTGTSVEIFATLMNDLDVDVVGINCTLEPKDMLPVFMRLAEYCHKPLSVEPNAGKPLYNKGALTYKSTPEEFAVYMADFVELGANLVGGCCGTGPDHIALMSKYVGKQKPRQRTVRNDQFLSSRTVIKTVEPFLVIGERINASGRKKLQKSFQDMDYTEMLNLARKQEEEGSAVIDVNLGIEKLLTHEHFKQALLELDRVSSLPLSLDIQDAAFLETAMREYVGRPLINSALAREEHLNSRLDLLKKYGGMLIVLTMEKDIPQTAQERLSVAKKAVEIIKANGVDLKRVFFDPLVLPLGAGSDYHVTLNTIKLLTESGLQTSIGLSNLSFGMPNRESINAAFLGLSVENGLSAAILNSKEATTMNVLQGCLALKGKQLGTTQNAIDDELVNLIVKGQKDALLEFTKQQLNEHDPLYVSQHILAEAMQKVGELYAKGVIYLPHLILAAETVQPCFDYLNSLLGEAQVKLGKVLLATVHGDIHDIGKNIVATVLRSGGFDVYDVGKDVPAHTILEACQEYKPDIVGLSAMMTTTVSQVKEVVDMLKANNIQAFVIAGGASMNRQLADEFGVEYAKDAMEALQICKAFMERKGGNEP